MPFEAVNLLPVKQEKILAFLPCSRSRSFTFVAKVSMEEVWTDGHQQREPAGHRQGGWGGGGEGHRLHRGAKKHVSVRQGEDIEKQTDRLPPREEVTRSVSVLPFENGLIFLTNRSSKQSKVSQWGYLWIERSIGKRASWVEPQKWSTNARATLSCTASGHIKDVLWFLTMLVVCNVRFNRSVELSIGCNRPLVRCVRSSDENGLVFPFKLLSILLEYCMCPLLGLTLHHWFFTKSYSNWQKTEGFY